MAVSKVRAGEIVEVPLPLFIEYRKNYINYANFCPSPKAQRQGLHILF
jgi:hypothetical protein